ncbi:MAG: hypothetical protein ACK4MY_14475, partial [Brevundimonas sp.]
MIITRRILLGAAAASVSACAGVPRPSTVDAARVYRDAIVINGNLVLPIDPDTPLDQETRDIIK